MGADDVAGLGGRLIEKFDAEVTESGGEKLAEESGTGLGHGMEKGVPASDIGAEGMLHAHAVAEVDAMGVTGPSAVRVVGPVGQERGKNAVLHVKHRHAVVDRQLEPIRRGGFQERENLRKI